MKRRLIGIVVLAAAVACGLAGQDAHRLEFEVASVKATVLDHLRISRLSMSGQLKVGPQIYGNRADYINMSLRLLVAEAYQVSPDVMDCPECPHEIFDIIAKMPAGSRKEDAPLMLQSLLADRFKLVVHREPVEETIVALVVGKDGPNLRESPSAAPLDFGHSEGEPPDNAAQAGAKKKVGSSASAMMRMGAAGLRFTPDPANSSVHLEASSVTMADLAHILMWAHIGDGRRVVDMTGLKESYEIVLDIPTALIGGMAGDAEASVSSDRSQPLPAEAAADPGSGRVMRSITSFGLELRKMKAPVEHLVVDHVERKPTEN